MRCTVGDSQGTVDQGLGSARHLSPHRHTLGRVKDVIHALDITYHRPASICGSNVGDGHGLFRLRGECSIGLSQFRSHPDLQPYALSRRIRIIVPRRNGCTHRCPNTRRGDSAGLVSRRAINPNLPLRPRDKRAAYRQSNIPDRGRFPSSRRPRQPLAPSSLSIVALAALVLLLFLRTPRRERVRHTHTHRRPNAQSRSRKPTSSCAASRFWRRERFVIAILSLPTPLGRVLAGE